MQNLAEPNNMFLWQAFTHLQHSRSVGFAAGRIPISEIKAYADYIEIDCPVQKTRLLTAIQAMDGTAVDAGSD